MMYCSVDGFRIDPNTEGDIGELEEICVANAISTPLR